jgi:antitoxin component YwqK of YwqJK toxin-antitoxin module
VAPATGLTIAILALSIAPAPTDGTGPHGAVRTFHPDGGLASERFYDHGVKIGRHRAFWPDGRLRLEATFVDGAYHGEVRSFHEDGRPHEVRRYVGGEEDGLQQIFEPDGSLRANYEVREGRRYGVIGSRPCATVRGASR